MASITPTSIAIPSRQRAWQTFLCDYEVALEADPDDPSGAAAYAILCQLPEALAVTVDGYELADAPAYDRMRAMEAGFQDTLSRDVSSRRYVSNFARLYDTQVCMAPHRSDYNELAASAAADFWRRLPPRFAGGASIAIRYHIQIGDLGGIVSYQGHGMTRLGDHYEELCPDRAHVRSLEDIMALTLKHMIDRSQLHEVYDSIAEEAGDIDLSLSLRHSGDADLRRLAFEA